MAAIGWMAREPWQPYRYSGHFRLAITVSMASGPTPDSAAPAVAGMTGSYHEALPVA